MMTLQKLMSPGVAQKKIANQRHMSVCDTDNKTATAKQDKQQPWIMPEKCCLTANRKQEIEDFRWFACVIKSIAMVAPIDPWHASSSG